MSSAASATNCLPARPLTACLLILCLVGCNQADNGRYVPASALAREALTAALQSWADGVPTPRLASGQPSLQFADSLRSGRTLDSFEVVGELPLKEGRRFEVQLTLSEPPGREKAHYIVLGIDPLWVIRQEDYDMITHWDHPMSKEPAPIQPAAQSESVGATKDE